MASRFNRSGQRSRSYLWILVALLLVVSALGAYNLYTTTIEGDEAHSIEDAGGPITYRMSPTEMWERIARTNPWHTPGYFMILSVWGEFVGWDPPVLRALSLFFGLLAIALTYRLGRDVVSPR